MTLAPALGLFQASAVWTLNTLNVSDGEAEAEDLQQPQMLRVLMDAVESPRFVADLKGYKFLGNVLGVHPNIIKVDFPHAQL